MRNGSRILKNNASIVIILIVVLRRESIFFKDRERVTRLAYRIVRGD